MNEDEKIRVLGKKYSQSILKVAHDPLPAQSIGAQLDIPVATCYRRIDELVDVGLLEPHDKVSTEDGQKATRFRRTTDRVCVHFADTTIEVTTGPQSEATAAIDAVWQHTTG
jgi:predicted ArsR family transcriptional regulator